MRSLCFTLLCFFGLLPCSGWMVRSFADDRPRPFSIGDTERDIKFFYDQYRQATSEDQKRNAINNILRIHNYIVTDPRYARAESLQGMRSRVVYQLRQISKDLERGLKKGGDADAAEHGAGRIQGTDKSISPGEQKNNGSGPDVDIAMSQNMSMLLQFTGGPSQLIGYAGNFGGGREAQELIQLIQATIAPMHWDVNGGPGHIHYYSPQMLLVIRAGSDVQDQAADLMQQLRANR